MLLAVCEAAFVVSCSVDESPETEICEVDSACLELSAKVMLRGKRGEPRGRSGKKETEKEKSQESELLGQRANMDGMMGVKPAEAKSSSSHCLKLEDHRLIQWPNRQTPAEQGVLHVSEASLHIASRHDMELGGPQRSTEPFQMIR